MFASISLLFGSCSEYESKDNVHLDCFRLDIIEGSDLFSKIEKGLWSLVVENANSNDLLELDTADLVLFESL